MKGLSLPIRNALCIVITLALLTSTFLLPVPVRGQLPPGRGKPVVITFGQPNIWSLDQAHYLLSQLRERSLNFQASELDDLDPNETHGTRVAFMRQIFELAGQFTQPITSGSPEPSPTNAEVPEGTPERVPVGNMLDGTILGTLLKNPEFQKKLFSDAKLNAITKLDNHIQLQYEIIARQLTLLRDEVRPGERLVFLELPQSIYTTDDKADHKMAQVYWQVDGFHLYDRLAELRSGIDLALDKAQKIKNSSPEILSMSDETCNARVILSLCPREDENCPRREACRQYRDVKYWESSANILRDKLVDEENEEARIKIQRLLEGASPDLPADGPSPTRKFVKLRSDSPNKSEPEHIDDKDMRVRTVDIIPHQSSLNVNDVQETVKSNFFSGAFSFLFGFGARTSFQRQRDQFEQFVHQELYASGFGKGDTLFGWTFGPLPGTKRVAPGLRTTFAALIVPGRADSLTLRARGCFFHRKDNQPPGPMMQNVNSDWWDNNDRECGDAKSYRLSIPSGGGTANFWIDGIQYLPHKEPGDRMIASLRGQNFTTQVGILINGFPLKQVVEVARKLPASVRNNSNRDCPAICGEYEVVGPSEISIAFELPEKFIGTPEITVVGPGRSVSLKHLPIRVTAFGYPLPFPRLSESPLMFGDGPTVRITDVRLFRDANDTTLGVLRGNGRLATTADIFVNGRKLAKVFSEPLLETGNNVAYFDPGKQWFRLRFAKSGDEKLDILVVDGGATDTRTVANPYAEAKKPPPLAVTDDSILAYDAAAGEMAVRLTGTGLAKVRLEVLKGATDAEITSQSATELIFRLVQPKVAVRIKLTDPNTSEELTRAIVRRTPPRAITEKRDTIDSKNN